VDEYDTTALLMASSVLPVRRLGHVCQWRDLCLTARDYAARPTDYGRRTLPVSDRLVRLSRVIRAGMVTYPGLPGSRITPYLAREASGERCATGTGLRPTRRGISTPR
jgi:hypothetical protein